MADLHAHLHYQHLANQEHLIRPHLLDCVHLTSGSEIPADTQLLITEDCTAEQLDALPCLTSLILPCAGVPGPMRTLLRERPNITPHNLHYNDISVAENALTLLLSSRKCLIQLDRSFRNGHWSPQKIDTSHAMIHGSRCLLLGYGAIGQALSPMLNALGMKLTIMKRHPDPEIGYPCYSPENWKSILPETDILICALPDTPETRGIIDQEVLEKLPGHAVVINVGRGNNIDEKALYLALKEKSIAAAGLDVWWNYPDTYPFITDDDQQPCFPSQYPYQELENVVMLPHRGADHRMIQLQVRLRSMLCDRINQLSQGESIPNQINLKLGY